MNSDKHSIINKFIRLQKYGVNLPNSINNKSAIEESLFVYELMHFSFKERLSYDLKNKLKGDTTPKQTQIVYNNIKFVNDIHKSKPLVSSTLFKYTSDGQLVILDHC
jgi:hypothetical protein